ncbi:MAG TPA: hypothetical protein VEA69_23885 [Tepidisphaeraceae bacterium]|nr:hypothetical protein [Tepidisphaeraceae bacterium]
MFHAHVQPLESRTLLAGNVTAVLVGGDLVLTGDAARNRVLITTGQDRDAQVRVVGLDDDTTINGEFDAAFSGVTGAVRVALGSGADSVAVRDLTLVRPILINTGRGGDTVSFQNATLGGVDAMCGTGDDTVTALDSAFARTALALGDGDDLALLHASAFDARLSVDGGLGDDSVSADGSTFAAGRRFTAESRPAGVSLDYSFATGRSLGWRAGFSDYPIGEDAKHQLEEGHADLPAPVGPGKGFMLSGMNHPDDLFMFLKRQLGAAQGLKPNTEYVLRIGATFASDAPSGTFGIGGAAGDSVYVKIGATTIEPRRTTSPVAFDPNWRMNIDKPDQAQNGRDTTVAGTVANGNAPDAPHTYKSLTRTQIHPTRVKTDAAGNLWVIVGTDSGFEGVTRLYYQSIQIHLTPVT